MMMRMMKSYDNDDDSFHDTFDDHDCHDDDFDDDGSVLCDDGDGFIDKRNYFGKYEYEDHDSGDDDKYDDNFEYFMSTWKKSRNLR